VARGRRTERRWVVEIPAVEADSLLRDLAVRYEQGRDLRRPEAGAAVAHVSIARIVTEAPGLPFSLVDRLVAVCANVERFPFEFRHLGVFQGGVVHLVPDRAEPFHELARRCASIPTIDGTSMQPAPGDSHLTLAYLSRPSVFADLQRYVGPLLPLRGQALEAHLVLLESRSRRLVRRLSLK
jgi:2'-5' RNA ligase superfamily protein